VSHSDAKVTGFEAACTLAHINFGADTEPSNTKPWTERRVVAVFDNEVPELTKEASMYAPNLNQN